MKSSTSSTVPRCVLISAQSSWVTPPGLSIKTRTTGARAPPANSTWTSSSPRSSAARRAISRTRASMEVPPSKAPRETPSQKPSEQKKKWAENPLATPPRSEQEADYTGTPRAWQPEKRRAMGGGRRAVLRQIFSPAVEGFDSSPKFRLDGLTDRPPVGVAAGEARLRGLHHRAHLLQRRRARLGNRRGDRLLDLLARGG